jgi:hypothetical protein
MKRVLNIGLLIFSLFVIVAAFSRDTSLISNIMTIILQIGIAYCLKELILMEN